jgi:tRNA(Glu) U13 pseudouridine synthase TruD
VLLFAKDFRANWESADSKQSQSDWKLAFELPRGAYATMIIRQLFIEGIELESVDDTDGEEQEEIHDAI